jgi:hypothetical protein
MPSAKSRDGQMQRRVFDAAPLSGQVTAMMQRLVAERIHLVVPGGRKRNAAKHVTIDFLRDANP